MATTLEAILVALEALLKGGVAAEVLRNEPPLAVEIPKSGLIILRDGDPGEPEVTMSPLTYHYEHEAEIEIFVQRVNGRDAAFDALRGQIGSLIASDRTLGGRCDWIEAAQARPLDLQTEGAGAVKAMSVPVTLHFTTSAPLI